MLYDWQFKGSTAKEKQSWIVSLSSLLFTQLHLQNYPLYLFSGVIWAGWVLKLVFSWWNELVAAS